MNIQSQVSKAARQEKKFQDYNERCTFHIQAKVSHSSHSSQTFSVFKRSTQRSTYCFLQDFAINLENKVFSINEALQMKSLTFVIDACKILAQARKVGIFNVFILSLFQYFQSVSYTMFLYGVICRAGAGVLVCLQLLQPGH